MKLQVHMNRTDPRKQNETTEKGKRMGITEKTENCDLHCVRNLPQGKNVRKSGRSETDRYCCNSGNGN
jgi:hypothetical protein